jgi:hypothetical protein
MGKVTKLWALAAACTVLVGCSSNGSGGGNNNSNAGAACYETAVAQSTADSGVTIVAACTACVENACASQLDALNTPCAGYVACACPGGTYSASAAATPSCEAQFATAACAQASQTVETCFVQGYTGSCLSACTVGDASVGDAQ